MKAYGPLRPDLTPLDLYAAGYTLRAHLISGWCWHKAHGRGESFGVQWATVEEAIADARWLMTRQQVGQMTLGVTA